jgi:hypothetical protein
MTQVARGSTNLGFEHRILVQFSFSVHFVSANVEETLDSPDFRRLEQYVRAIDVVLREDE